MLNINREHTCSNPTRDALILWPILISFPGALTLVDCKSVHYYFYFLPSFQKTMSTFLHGKRTWQSPVSADQHKTSRFPICRQLIAASPQITLIYINSLRSRGTCHNHRDDNVEKTKIMSWRARTGKDGYGGRPGCVCRVSTVLHQISSESVCYGKCPCDVFSNPYTWHLL